MFQKAEKKKSKIRMALTGPSGSGKTMTALRIANGIIEKTGGKIAVIDTEKGSASLYADKFNFDVVELEAPYTVDAYKEAIKAANEYDVLIIDSTTHGWNYIVNFVDQKAMTKKYNNNTFRAWSEGTPLYTDWVNSMLNFKGHLIITMRAKTEYVMSFDDVTKKQKVEKVGMGSENRKGIEYEFTILAEGDLNHNFEFTKDRTSTLQGQIITEPGEELGKQLIDWVEDGIDVEERYRENFKKALEEIQEAKDKETFIKLCNKFSNYKDEEEFITAITPLKNKFISAEREDFIKFIKQIYTKYQNLILEFCDQNKVSLIEELDNRKLKTLNNKIKKLEEESE